MPTRELIQTLEINGANVVPVAVESMKSDSCASSRGAISTGTPLEDSTARVGERLFEIGKDQNETEDNVQYKRQGRSTTSGLTSVRLPTYLTIPY